MPEDDVRAYRFSWGHGEPVYQDWASINRSCSEGGGWETPRAELPSIHARLRLRQGLEFLGVLASGEEEARPSSRRSSRVAAGVASDASACAPPSAFSFRMLTCV